jgi:hypothetical protein
MHTICNTICNTKVVNQPQTSSNKRKKRAKKGYFGTKKAQNVDKRGYPKVSLHNC